MATGDFKMGPKEWDAAAEAYARLREPLTLPFGIDTLAALRVQPGERLLDLAAGTGGVALAAARRGAEVVAVDFARHGGLPRHTGERRGDRGRLSTGHGRAAPGPPDRTLRRRLLRVRNHVLPRPPRRADRTAAVLKPGGRVGVAVWACPSRMEHLAVWERAIRSVQSDASAFPRPPAWVQMDTPDGLRQEMEGVGFQDVSVVPVAHQWKVPSAGWFVENTDPGWAFFERLGPNSRDRIRESVLAQLRADYGDGPLALTAHAHIGIATK